MSARAVRLAVVLAISLPLADPAMSQGYGQSAPGLPPGHGSDLSRPHGNDPHRPGYQPPLQRPGLPTIHGPAHSNDPHYRRVEPQIVWPRSATRPGLSPAPIPRTGHAPYLSGGGRPRAERARRPARNLAECIDRWTPSERISRAEWEAACRRLEVSGRVRTR